jgi:hypothetical protein
MSDEDFQEQARLYAAGGISRRRFLKRVVAGGATLAAANALVMAVAQPTQAARGAVYGYPTPPGQGGSAPGKGGTPPGLLQPPPGLGGTRPGRGGTPPGRV